MSHNHIVFITRQGLLSALAILTALATACSKSPQGQDMGQPSEAVVSFSIQGLGSGDIGQPQTKAGQSEDIGAALLATRPTDTPTLTIQSQTVPSRRYTAQVGQPVSLPLDTYSVTGEYVSPAKEATIAGSCHATPPYSIEQTIVVSEESSEFPLSAQYSCFAIVLDTRECTGYKHTYVNNAYTDASFWVTVGDIKLFYLKPSGAISKDKAYKVMALPVDEAQFERKEYKLISDKAAGYVQAVNGRWYCFSPGAVDTASGDIGVAFPDWEQGGTE